MEKEKKIFDIRSQLIEYDHENQTVTLKLIDEIDLNKMPKLEKDGKYYTYLDFYDPRMISDAQRSYFWALMGNFADHVGHLKRATGDFYLFEFMEKYNLPEFPSTRRNGMKLETARKLLQFVLDDFIEKEIPFYEQRFYLAEDESRLFYALTMNRICWICGKENSSVHHAVNLVGRGRDRTKHNHLKSKFICLCEFGHNVFDEDLTTAHHQEAHSLGLTKFMDRYHVKPIKLKKEDLKQLGIRGNNKEE